MDPEFFDQLESAMAGIARLYHWRKVRSEYPQEGPAMKLWSFGYACNLQLRAIPEPVAKRFGELNPDTKVLRYYENVRRARGEERRRQSG